MTNLAQSHDPTMEYSEITPNIYVGTSMCCKQHAEHHWQELSKLDVYADIDLRREQEEIPHKVEVHLKLPVVDTYPPTPLQTKIGVDTIDSAVKDGKKVYVHCQIGHGRSPTLVAAYFILKEGLSAVDAVAKVKKGRPEAHPTDRQLEFLNTLEKVA